MRRHKLSFLLDFGLYVLVQTPREEPYRAAQGDLSRDWTSRAFRRKHNATALAPWLDSSVTLCNTIRLRVYSRDAEIPVDSLVQSNVNVCSSVILDGPVPKAAGQRLVRSSSRAVGDT